MRRKIKVRRVVSGTKLRIAATAYILKTDSEPIKTAIKAARNEEARRLYFRKMRDRLNELIEINFTGSDWSLVLTVTDEFLSGDYDRLRTEWRRALARLRYARRKVGRPEPVYIYVIEGFHGARRPHIHLLLKKTEDPATDIQELDKIWRSGSVEKYTLEEVEWRDDPAKYLTKEPNKFVPRKLDRNCYVASRNCQRPFELEPVYVDCLEEVDNLIPDGYAKLSDASNRKRTGAGALGQIVAISRFLTLEDINGILPSCNSAEHLKEIKKASCDSCFHAV